MSPKLSIFVIFIIVIILGFVVYIKFTAKSFQQSSEVLPKIESFPFAEMTVPYLRKQNFESNLGALEKISENSSYTSYLTSYTSDGLKINGLLTKPAGEVPVGGWSAIIFIHGYISPAQYRTMEKYVAYVDFLASNGFVVFKIDLRGHGDSQGDPGGAYYSADYIIDTLNAYSALQSTDFVDPKKIGLWGHSMAGNIVLRTLAVKPEIPVAVIWAGAVYSYEDFAKYRLSDHSYLVSGNNQERRQRRRQELFNVHGAFDKNSEFWKQVVPTNYLNDFKGAIQIHHAINDDVVNIGYSRDLVNLLNRTSVPYEFYEYKTGRHNIDGASFNAAIERSAEFFKQYLLP